MNVKEKVFEIVASVCETEVSNVNENSTIGDFPQWDSMGHLTILSNVEEAFDINFEPEEMMDLLIGGVIGSIILIWRLALAVFYLVQCVGTGIFRLTRKCMAK